MARRARRHRERSASALPTCLPLVGPTPRAPRPACPASCPSQALPSHPAVVVLDAYSFIRGSVGSYVKARSRAAAGRGGRAPAVWQGWVAGWPGRTHTHPPLATHPPPPTMQNAENEMSIIAAYYGLPTLSVRAATFHQMLRNQHGYRVSS